MSHVRDLSHDITEIVLSLLVNIVNFT